MNQQLENYHALLKEVLSANIKPIDLEALESAKALAEMGMGAGELHNFIDILNKVNANQTPKPQPKTFAENIEDILNGKKTSD